MHDSLLLFVFLGLGTVSKNSISVQSFANIWQITVNPLLSPPGGLFISSPFEAGGSFEAGGLFERGAGGFFILEKTMVLVLHKELEYDVDKPQYKKF